MTAMRKKRQNRDAEGKFFLYVAFHSAWTAVLNFFDD